MRILIADDQARVRLALRVLLTQQVGYQVVGEARNGKELLAEAQATAPDLAVVDWELPGMGEAGGLVALRKVAPDLRIVALSGQPGARRDALASGADVFVSKGDPPDRVLAAVCGGR